MKLLSAVVIAALAATPCWAQGNLLEQGRNLLNLPGQQPRSAPAPGSGAGSGLSTGEIGSGLKEALRIGSDRTVGRLGRPDGFLKDPAVHIPLPGILGQAQSALKMVGAGGLVDDLETRMNRAAEAAAPKARDIFFRAVAALTIDDAQGILRGPKDAATQYFRRTTARPLSDAMRPVIDQSLRDAGAVQALQSVTARFKSLPMGSMLDVDLTGHVLQKALDGLFHYLAREEAAIRDNPAQRSTDLLRKVFG